MQICKAPNRTQKTVLYIFTIFNFVGMYEIYSNNKGSFTLRFAPLKASSNFLQTEQKNTPTLVLTPHV